MVDKTHKKILNRIAKNTKRIRKSHGLTQEQMRDYGFNVRHFQRIEQGTAAVNTRTLSRLCDVFDVDILEFFKPVKKA